MSSETVVFEALVGDHWEPERLGLFSTREKAQAAIDAHVERHTPDGGTYYGFTDIDEVVVQ